MTTVYARKETLSKDQDVPEGNRLKEVKKSERVSYFCRQAMPHTTVATLVPIIILTTF